MSNLRFGFGFFLSMFGILISCKDYSSEAFLMEIPDVTTTGDLPLMGSESISP